MAYISFRMYEGSRKERTSEECRELPVIGANGWEIGGSCPRLAH